MSLSLPLLIFLSLASAAPGTVPDAQTERDSRHDATDCVSSIAVMSVATSATNALDAAAASASTDVAAGATVSFATDISVDGNVAPVAGQKVAAAACLAANVDVSVNTVINVPVASDEQGAANPGLLNQFFHIEFFSNFYNLLYWFS